MGCITFYLTHLPIHEVKIVSKLLTLLRETSGGNPLFGSFSTFPLRNGSLGPATLGLFSPPIPLHVFIPAFLFRKQAPTPY